MAANQKRNFKVKHAKPVPGHSPHPTVRAPPAPSSEQLLQSLRNAIQTTNEVVGDPKCNNNNNTQRNGSIDTSLSAPDGARLKAEPWRRGTGGSENQVIPPPGFFNDEEEGATSDWQLTVTRIPEGLAGDDILLPPPVEFDVDAVAVVSRSFTDKSNGKDAGRVIGSGLPGNGNLLPPPAVFDNGCQGNGSCIDHGYKKDVSREKVRSNVEPVVTEDYVHAGGKVEGLPGVTIATASVALPDVAIAKDSVGGVDVDKKSDILRRGDGDVEGKIIGGLFSVREICALIENDRMFVLQGVMDEESTQRLQRKSNSVSASTGKLQLKQVSISSNMEKLEQKPVSVSCSAEKLELKPVSASSSMEKLEMKPVSVSSSLEKLEQKPVSVSSSVELKPVSDSSRLDVEEVDNDVRANKAAADAVTMITVTSQNGSCHSDVKGPSSLKVMALDASKKLQAAGTASLDRDIGGTLPTYHEANREGNSSAVNGKLLSEPKEVDGLSAKSIPGISVDGIPTGSYTTTDAPKVPNSNHSASVAAEEHTADAATPFDLNKTTPADLDRLSRDPDMPSPGPVKTPPYPAVLEESKALDSEYAAVSLEAEVRVDRSKTSEPVSPAINTGESKSDAGPAGTVQGCAGVSTTAERNPKPESIVTTHLWSDTAVARVLNVNAGISTDLSKAGLLSADHCETGVREIKSGSGREESGKLSLEGKSSTNNGDNSARKIASKEKRKMEVVRVDVTESLEQTENERHFISKTVKTTMTQETRSSAVGTPPGVGMATNIGARPKAGSMFAAGSEVKMEALEDGFFDGKGSNENTGLLGELRKNRPSGIEGLKDTGGVAEKGIDRETGGRTPGKQSSVFDMLLDQRELKSDRNSWSVFERREASRHQTEASSCSAVPSPVNLTSPEFDASVRIPSPSSPVDATPNARIADGNDEVSVTKESLPSPTTSSPSPVVPIRVTERKEEVVRVPRPTSLMVRPGKPPRHSISHPSTPTTQLNASTHSETSHTTTSSVYAPLATPEECFDDVTYPNRSRQSSVGPSRSRQSSVGPCRSRQSSIGSLLGYQMAQSGVSTHFVVVAIDFGTTYSGYAFSFTRDPESIHMMRRWEGGDPGIVNQKTPTTLLLSPEGKFHSFGFAARDFYHDLDPQEAKKWLYFEKFKMTLHHNADLNKETTIKASNGKAYPALSVFSHALTFFKDHALQELSDQSSTTILNEDIRWVITVPAIWKAPAKQFMRQAAYVAGIASADNPNQLLIALEPEAASIYVRKLRLYQLMPDPMMTQLLSKREPTPDPPLNRDPASDDEFASVDSVKYKTLPTSVSYRHSISPSSTTASVGQEVEIEGTNYMVVDCGGGTVDITVYEMESGFGHLKELHKATGGPYGSLGIDLEFENLLIRIFGSEFIEAFRTKRPAGWVDLMIAFESRKRTASPFKNNPLNVSLPFSFIDYYKKHKGSQVESAIRKYGNKDVTWSSQGMLRLTPAAMRRLFQPTLDHIKQAIGDVLNNPSTRDIKYMFLVGGFAESAILQMEMRKEFEHLLKILIPQDVGLTILKGAVCFGLDPTIVSVRRSRMTYGVGVLNRFVPDKHPRSKMITKDGAQWCTDVFDKFVEVDQSVAVGETVVRSYAPAKAGQKSTIIHIYSSEKLNPQYITDPGVKRCGTLCLDLTDVQYRHSQKPRRREIQARMTFGDTEIKVTALDVATGKCVRAAIDFMNK